jgi:hypothetical protein
MSLGLREIPNYDQGTACVPTMMAAITGMTPAAAAKLIADVAPNTAQPAIVAPDPKAAFNINHWLPALCALGLRVTEHEGWWRRPYEEWPPMEAFLKGYRPTDTEVYLMFGERIVVGEESVTHVFAIQGDSIVDTSTFGKKERMLDVSLPAGFNDFRVKRVFRVNEH